MLTRRSFLAVAAGAATLFAAGCAGGKGEVLEEASVAAGNVLVAYFSATGNTEAAATAVAERLGADGTNPELTQVTPDGWADYASGLEL